MSSEWYYSLEGKRYGPIPLSELKRLLKAGDLALSAFVWEEGLPEWVKASSIKELALTEDRSSSQCPPPLPSKAVGEKTIPLPQEGGLTLELRTKADQNHLYAARKLAECETHRQFYDGLPVSAAENGLEFIEAALQIDPKSSSYWNTKGLLLSEGLGEYQKSLDCLRRALELEPDSIAIKQNIRMTEEGIKFVKQHKTQPSSCLGLFLVLAASGLSIITALFIFLLR